MRWVVVTAIVLLLAASAVALALTPPSQYVRPGLTLYYEVYKVNLRTKSSERIGYISFTVTGESGGAYVLEISSSSPDINGKKVVVDVNGRTREGDLVGLWLPEGFQPGQSLVIGGVQTSTQVKDNYIVAAGQRGGLYYLWAFEQKNGLMVMHIHADPSSGAGIMWKLVRAGYGGGGGQPQTGPTPQTQPQPTQSGSPGIPLGLLIIAFLILGGGLLLYLRSQKGRKYPQYPQPYPPAYPQPQQYGQPYQQPYGAASGQYPGSQLGQPGYPPGQATYPGAAGHYPESASGYQQPQRQQPRFCPRCGAPLPPGATVCPRCGARVA